MISPISIMNGGKLLSDGIVKCLLPGCAKPWFSLYVSIDKVWHVNLHMRDLPTSCPLQPYLRELNTHMLSAFTVCKYTIHKIYYKCIFGAFTGSLASTTHRPKWG